MSFFQFVAIHFTDSATPIYYTVKESIGHIKWISFHHDLEHFHFVDGEEDPQIRREDGSLLNNHSTAAGRGSSTVLA
jgi:hypothetical protein